MTTSKSGFLAAADRIRDRTIALVYARSFDSEVLHSIILRQRTDRLAGYRRTASEILFCVSRITFAGATHA